MAQDEFSGIMNMVWRLAETDKAKAISILQENESRADFYPWGGHALLAFSLDLQRRQTAYDQSVRLSELCPEFKASWWPSLKATRGADIYRNICDNIAVRIPNLQGQDVSDLRVPITEALLTSRAKEAGDAISGLMRDAAMGAYYTRVDMIRAFLSDCEAEIESRVGNFEFWRFGFDREEAKVFLRDQVAVINLSRLALDKIDEPLMQICERMTVAASCLMGWNPYADDRGVSSWPTIEPRDFWSATFWRETFAPIEWLELRRFESLPLDSTAGPSFVRSYSFPKCQFAREPAKLHVRIGNVEAWALWSYLDDPPATLSAATDVCAAAENAARGGGSFIASYKKPWINRVENVTRLCTNAGWYAKPPLAANSFRDWAERYQAALDAGTLLAGHDVELLPIVSRTAGLRGKTPLRWDDEEFASILNGAKVVFVTAFATQIEQFFNTGGLESLWREVNVSSKMKSLETVLAPMSIWPYYPGESWSSTYGDLWERVSDAINRSNADVFVASCGSYGLPIVHQVYKEYSIASIYYGHQANIYFGMLTGAGQATNFYKRNPKSPLWQRPDLSVDYPVVARVDDGRYV